MECCCCCCFTAAKTVLNDDALLVVVGNKKLVADETVGLLLLDKNLIDLVDAIAERLRIVGNDVLNMTFWL